jgi:hypothetical protein
MLNKCIQIIDTACDNGQLDINGYGTPIWAPLSPLHVEYLRCYALLTSNERKELKTILGF